MSEMTVERQKIPCVEYQPVLFVGEPEGKPGDGVWISGYALVRGVAITPAGEPIFLSRQEDPKRTVQLWGRLTGWFYMAVYLRMLEIWSMVCRWTFARKRTR